MGVTLYIITNGWEERSTPANTKWSVFIQSSAKSQYKVKMYLHQINSFALYNDYKLKELYNGEYY